MDFVLCNGAAVVRDATVSGVNPVRVRLDYPKPRDDSALERHFRCERVFSSPSRATVYAVADLTTRGASQSRGWVRRWTSMRNRS